MRPRLVALAASLSAALLAGAPVTRSAGAQDVPLSADADLLAAPGGRVVAVLRPGARVTAGAARNGFTEVTVEGWVSARLLGGPGDSLAVTVHPVNGARLRATPAADAPLVADLRRGTGLVEVTREGNWVQVRRTGWVREAAIAGSGVSAPPPTLALAQTPATTPSIEDVAPLPLPLPASDADDGARTTDAPLTVRTAPDGSPVAVLQPGGRTTVLARDRDWVRVRVEGWVRERDLRPADAGTQRLSAADLRADPAGTRGRVVHWEVQYLALQRADPLRKDLAPDEPYLLARGPGEENSLLYLAVPPSLLTTVRALPLLTRVVITARVRTGRSDPVGVPILDLQGITRR